VFDFHSFNATTQKHKRAGMEPFYGRSSCLKSLALGSTRLAWPSYINWANQDGSQGLNTQFVDRSHVDQIVSHRPGAVNPFGHFQNGVCYVDELL